MTCHYSAPFRGTGIVASAAQDAQDDSVERVDPLRNHFFWRARANSRAYALGVSGFFQKHSFLRAPRSVLLGMTQLFGSATRKAELDSMQKMNAPTSRTPEILRATQFFASRDEFVAHIVLGKLSSPIGGGERIWCPYIVLGKLSSPIGGGERINKALINNSHKNVW